MPVEAADLSRLLEVLRLLGAFGAAEDLLEVGDHRGAFLGREEASDRHAAVAAPGIDVFCGETGAPRASSLTTRPLSADSGAGQAGQERAAMLGLTKPTARSGWTSSRPQSVNGRDRSDFVVVAERAGRRQLQPLPRSLSGSGHSARRDRQRQGLGRRAGVPRHRCAMCASTCPRACDRATPLQPDRVPGRQLLPAASGRGARDAGARQPARQGRDRADGGGVRRSGPTARLGARRRRRVARSAASSTTSITDAYGRFLLEDLLPFAAGTRGVRFSARPRAADPGRDQQRRHLFLRRGLVISRAASAGCSATADRS